MALEGEQLIQPPKNPLTVKLNLAVLDYYFQAFVKKWLPAFTPVITSSYRTGTKNKEVGGAANSAHLHGLAYDFILKNSAGQAIPKLQAKKVFDEFIFPNWSGFSLFEADESGGYHIHVNLSREISTYAGLTAIAGIGVIGFAIIQSWGGSKT